jgi:hypothetical protein
MTWRPVRPGRALRTEGGREAASKTTRIQLVIKRPRPAREDSSRMSRASNATPGLRDNAYHRRVLRRGARESTSTSSQQIELTGRVGVGLHRGQQLLSGAVQRPPAEPRVGAFHEPSSPGRCSQGDRALSTPPSRPPSRLAHVHTLVTLCAASFRRAVLRPVVLAQGLGCGNQGDTQGSSRGRHRWAELWPKSC